MNLKGQGTTEYLIILAVVIVIALVVAGVLGFFPGFAAGISEQESKAYWQSTSPLALSDWKVESTAANARFTLRNNTIDKLQVTEITVNGAAIGAVDQNIAAGASATISGATGISCTSGSSYQYEVSVAYDVVGGISGKTLRGLKPIIGTCP